MQMFEVPVQLCVQTSGGVGTVFWRFPLFYRLLPQGLTCPGGESHTCRAAEQRSPVFRVLSGLRAAQLWWSASASATRWLRPARCPQVAVSHGCSLHLRSHLVVSPAVFAALSADRSSQSQQGPDTPGGTSQWGSALAGDPVHRPLDYGRRSGRVSLALRSGVSV